MTSEDNCDSVKGKSHYNEGKRVLVWLHWAKSKDWWRWVDS